MNVLPNKAMLVLPEEDDNITINTEIKHYATVFSIREMKEIEKKKLYEELLEYTPYFMLELIYISAIFMFRRQSFICGKHNKLTHQRRRKI